RRGWRWWRVLDRVGLDHPPVLLGVCRLTYRHLAFRHLERYGSRQAYLGQFLVAPQVERRRGGKLNLYLIGLDLGDFLGAVVTPDDSLRRQFGELGWLTVPALPLAVYLAYIGHERITPVMRK